MKSWDSCPKSVSVIVPAYNRADFIGNAVKSIEEQDYENLEIIIVDDGSTDGTRDVVTRLQDYDPRIRLLANTRAKGPSGARNTGLLASSGEYIAFLDSDDVWLPGRLGKGIEILEGQPDIGVLFGNYTVADYPSGRNLFNFFDRKDVLRTLKTRALPSGAMVIEDNLFIGLVRENFFSLGSSLHRKDMSEGVLFEERVTYAEDRDFAIRLCMEKHARFAFREDPFFIAYRHDSSLTQYDGIEKRQKLVEAHLFLFSKYLRDYALTAPEKALLSRSISEGLLSLASLHGEKRKLRPMLLSILKSLKYGVSLGQPRSLLKLLYLTAVLR